MLLLGWREKKHEEGKRAHYMLLLLLLLLSLVIVSARRCLIVKQMNELTNGGGISPPPLPSCDRALNARIVLRSVHADSSRTTRGSCSRRSGFVVREKGAEVLHCEAFALSRVLSRSTLKSGGRIRV